MCWLSSELPDSPSVTEAFQSLIAPSLSHKGFYCPTLYPKYLNSEVQIGFYHILWPDQLYWLPLSQTYSRCCLYSGWKELCYHYVGSRFLRVVEFSQSRVGDWHLFVFCVWGLHFLLPPQSYSTFSTESVHSGLSAVNSASSLSSSTTWPLVWG